jgi:peptidoglycan hydrolase-like protein with peptidoglycan-binding domain
LNDVLGLQLPVHGIVDAATRSAIRSFQQRERLPTDGIVGPDTERALLAARSGKQGAAGSDAAVEPAATATEFSFESENFAFEFQNARRPAVGG